jgi:hypothetical protein
LTSARQRALEAVSVVSVSKTAFHQMLPAFPIELGSFAIGLPAGSIQRGFDRDGV